MVNFIGGLGGRELTPEMMDEMADLTRRPATARTSRRQLDRRARVE